MTLRADITALLALALISVGGAAGVCAAREYGGHQDAQDGDSGRGNSSHAEGPAELIHHADTFYWVSMQERGSMRVIELGLKYLDEAEKQLADAQLTAEEENTLRREIAGLRDDLENQKEVHYNTFYGVFPLARFVAPTLFSDPRASGSFELIDDPDEVATRESVEELIEHVVEAQTVIPQFDVVFVSDPPSRELENEALYAFNRSARFFVHNRRELAQVLDVGEADVDEIWPGGQMDPSADVLRKMVENWQSAGLFRSSHLLLVRVRKIDAYHGDYFYIAEGRIFEATPGAPLAQSSSVLNQYGFCIDRRDMLVPILGLHGLLLLGSLLVYPLLVKLTSHARRAPSWQNTVLFGGLGFVWGRGLIWALVPVLSSLRPDAETLAIWSFWWPALAGVVFTLGPAVVLGFANRRFNWFGSTFGTFNRGGAFFASISLGSVAFLGQCVLIYEGTQGWLLIPPLLLTSVLAAFTVGRALDKTDAMPFSAGIAAGVLTLLVGAAWCHSSAGLLWMTLIPLAGVFLVSAGHGVRPAPAAQAPPAPREEPAKKAAPTNSQELAERAYNPPYYESASFRKLQESLQPWRDGKTVKLGLSGPAGVGKSAALNVLEARARQQHADLIVLKGACDQPQADSDIKPYEPFTEAIAEHFAVNLLAPRGDQMGQIDDALGGLFDRVVPFADILFPPSRQSQTGSKQELFTAIAAMLRRLASRHSVMLIFDDVHWMDPASTELLEFLLAEFPASDPCPMAILLASRAEMKFGPGFENAPVLEMEPLNDTELGEILVDRFGLNADVAAEVLDEAGQQSTNLHWLFQIVAHLAQQDLLVRRDDGFCWKDATIKIGEHLPDDIRQSLEQVITKNREFRPVLECAACIGQEFSADLISSSLDLPRLDLIHLLDRIEEQTGIVTDLRDIDDRFAFRSSFFLEVLRKVREVRADGPRDGAMPQRIREYHYRLASALEKTLNESNATLYAVANHYYAAGGRHAGKALEYSVKAAKAACFQFQHDLARKYLAMAEDCAAFTPSSDFDFERELLLIHCHQAHVEGKLRVRTANEAQEYLQRRPDSDFDVHRAVAQASYDAGIDTRSQQHFDDCIRVAQAMLERFEAPAQQAEAHHFCGIGLPTSQRDQRRRHLQTARELAEQACRANGDDLDALRLRARIASSLAEDLSYGTPAERDEARALFQLSIEIKQREDIRDLEGLAFAHGGLGRLAFYGDPPDFAEARKHFEEDLRYSERIGSVTGKTKMHSFLGACALGEGRSESRFEEALTHYRAAHALALATVDRLFALAGLLQCHAPLGHAKAVDEVGNELLELIQSEVDELPDERRSADPVAAVPPMCRENVEAALKTCQQFVANSQWLRSLTDLLVGNRAPSSF